MTIPRGLTQIYYYVAVPSRGGTNGFASTFTSERIGRTRTVPDDDFLFFVLYIVDVVL